MQFLQQILVSQFEAALAMLDDCIQKCPPEHWDGKIAKYPFWQVAYHTLCFVDLYLSPNEQSHQLSDIHPQGWREYTEEYPSQRFEKTEIAAYLMMCRRKAIEKISSETVESMQGPSGFPGRPRTRGELHLYNLRHLQHHVGQLGAYLRRVDPAIDPAWIGMGGR